MPDYILSATLEKDLNVVVRKAAAGLKKTKYFPENVKIETEFGTIPDGRYGCVELTDWEDFSIKESAGEPLYTKEILEDIKQDEFDPLAYVLLLIVNDICNDGLFFSQDWYYARVLLEYFRETPTPQENAFLIGMLWKELSLKESFEEDLVEYYDRLKADQNNRSKGTAATKEKAENLRSIGVEIAAKLAIEQGPRMMMAPAIVRAREIRKFALAEYGDVFVRSGKPYSEQWFLNNVVEDRREDILQEIERLDRAKKA